ncbi:MAG: hypothetical protein ACLS3M_02945 [Collinsella sp.]
MTLPSPVSPMPRSSSRPPTKPSVDANLEIVKAKAELASDEALKADLEAVDHKASLAAGTTGNEKLVKLNAAYARYKTAVVPLLVSRLL